jgi:hypothetical protein
MPLTENRVFVPELKAVVDIKVGDPKRTKVIDSKRLRLETLEVARDKVEKLRRDCGAGSAIVSIVDDRGEEFSFAADTLVSISVELSSAPMII